MAVKKTISKRKAELMEQRVVGICTGVFGTGVIILGVFVMLPFFSNRLDVFNLIMFCMNLKILCVVFL